MNKPLKIGDTIPDFSVKDFDGDEITLEDMIGNPFVLYFYPADGTPGCTKEACQFRDLMDSFEDIEIAVFGVSPDSPKSHQKFMEEQEINFPLLSDESKDLCRKCGVLDEKGSVIRTTYICDGDGVVQWVESPVNVEEHAERVIEAVREVLA